MNFRQSTLLALVATVLSGIVMVPAWAQFIDPTALPPGGHSATWLDTTTSTQKKLGSLLVGDNSGTDQLCLNGTDAVNCISSWADLSGQLGGPFVRLRQDQVPNPALVTSYANYLQAGFAGLQGSGGTAAPTVTTNPDIGAGTKVGLYASDGLDYTSFAARFGGRLSITNHNNPPVSNPGEVCLNATTPYNGAAPAPRYGCIDAWTDLGGGAIGAYIHLYNSNPPTYDLGAGWIGTGVGAVRGAWNTSNALVGGVTNIGGTTHYCGDSLCSLELLEGPPFNFCPADCQ